MNCEILEIIAAFFANMWFLDTSSLAMVLFIAVANQAIDT
jgi:hypothetical protein